MAEISEQVSQVQSPSKFQRWKSHFFRFENLKNILWVIFRALLIIGMSYIVLYPILMKLSVAFKAKQDMYNPMVIWIPIHYTLFNIRVAYHVMTYWQTLLHTVVLAGGVMILQVISCALAGYGFARLKFRGSNVLFALVILTILVPKQILMVPMYIHFKSFDILGIIHLVSGHKGLNLLNTYWPSFITSATANGLKSGLFIYIFRQFFRGAPKEIEEAALIDGAGIFKTFYQIMLPNAIPSIITVALFAFVWQYNDTFYTGIFMSNSDLMSTQIISLGNNASTYLNTLLGNQPNTKIDPFLQSMISNTGILMAIAPLVIMYIFVQRFFVESVERTGIVG